VEDVAEAIARALQRTQTHAITFECGGPCVYSYGELLRALARKADLKRILIPLPFAAWWALAWTAELLPNPPVTRNQVELMQVDNVCSPGCPDLQNLEFRRTRWRICSSRRCGVARAACRTDANPKPDGIFGKDRLVAGVSGYMCDQCVTKCVAVLGATRRIRADGPMPLL